MLGHIELIVEILGHVELQNRLVETFEHIEDNLEVERLARR